MDKNENEVKIKKVIQNTFREDKLHSNMVKTRYDLKFPTFDDEHLDNELRNEITYNSLITEIHSTLLLLSHFETEFELLHIKNKTFIKALLEFNVNYLTFKLHGICLHRLITLILQKLILKFDDNNPNSKFNDQDIDIDIDKDCSTNSLIEKEYISKKEEDLIKIHIIEKITDKDNLQNDYEDPCLKEIIKKELDYEQEVLSCNHFPSITSIYIIIKNVKYYLEKIMECISQFKELTSSDFKDHHFLTLYQYVILLSHKNSVHI